MTEQMQDIGSGGAYLLLQATDPMYSAEYRIGLLDKAAEMIADLRDALARELTGLDKIGDAPTDV